MSIVECQKRMIALKHEESLLHARLLEIESEKCRILADAGFRPKEIADAINWGEMRVRGYLARNDIDFVGSKYKGQSGMSYDNSAFEQIQSEYESACEKCVEETMSAIGEYRDRSKVRLTEGEELERAKLYCSGKLRPAICRELKISPTSYDTWRRARGLAIRQYMSDMYGELQHFIKLRNKYLGGSYAL